VSAIRTTPTSTGTLEPSRSRAAALPPEERRARIVEATLPLLLAHGTALTTRQIAEAAGIAEGTIFRVFPDKESLIAAVVDAALDTTTVDAQFDAIDVALPLDARLTAAVEILRRRMAEMLQLRAAVGILDQRPSADMGALAAVFEPDRAALRRDPVQAAHLLRGLTLAGTHPSLAPEEPLTSEEIVSLLLDGLRRHDGEDAR
jgi:AcrR family transcriptional regulator